MVNTDIKKYLLVIKRGKNDYLPLEWNLLDGQNAKNINSLVEIDEFTKSKTRIELIEEGLKANIIELTDKFTSFSIIYYENGKTRELKEGTVFKEDTNILTEQDFIRFIIENTSNKNIINEIYNICNSKESEQHLEEFKFILKNIDLFLQRGVNALIIALSKFSEISYSCRRSIIIRVSQKIIPKTKNNNQNIKLNKIDKNVA